MDADLMRALRDAQSGDPDALRAATTALVRAGYRDERVVLVIDNGYDYSGHMLHFVDVTGIDVEAAKAVLLKHGIGTDGSDSFVDSTIRGDWDGTALPLAAYFTPPAQTIWLDGNGRETPCPRWDQRPGAARPVPLRTHLDPARADELDDLRPFASVLAEGWRDPALVRGMDELMLRSVTESWSAKCAIVCDAWGVEWRGMLPDKGES